MLNFAKCLFCTYCNDYMVFLLWPLLMWWILSRFSNTKLHCHFRNNSNLDMMFLLGFNLCEFCSPVWIYWNMNIINYFFLLTGNFSVIWLQISCRSCKIQALSTISWHLWRKRGKTKRISMLSLTGQSNTNFVFFVAL